jgi:hypothetical protein
MLDKQTVQKINDFVYAKPRTVAEIAAMLQVNWRTANRYIDKIEKEDAIFSTRVFREGTPGALKVVFWNNVEKLHASEVQERLYSQIEVGRQKHDFSPSEIYQFVEEKKRELIVLTEKEHNSKANFNDFANSLISAEKQILFFSGNMTFSRMSSHDQNIRKILEELGKKKVFSKILTRVEVPGIENIRDVLSINSRLGFDAVEIRHCYQPLRTTVIDSKMATMKEMLDPKDYAEGELKQKLFFIYTIYDEHWIEWLQKIFWDLFRKSIDARKRLQEFKKIL